MFVQLRSRVANADTLRAKKCFEDDAVLKIQGDADVYRPDGVPLLFFRKAVIPDPLMETAYDALHALRVQKGYNRGAYSGGERTAPKFKDGTMSKNSYVLDETGKRLNTSSAVVGYFDRQGGRFPFCRETQFTSKEVEKWKTILPMTDFVARLFEKTVPDRYKRQLQECGKCPDYVVKKTPFTTLTVNNNGAPAGIHKDAGDFKEGFGVISYLCRGEYDGGWLVFPEYQVGVNPRHGDVLFFNSHDWHGVTPMVKKSDDAERISVVYYMRSRMTKCLPKAEELKRAKSLGEL